MTIEVIRTRQRGLLERLCWDGLKEDMKVLTVRSECTGSEQVHKENQGSNRPPQVHLEMTVSLLKQRGVCV